MGEERWIAFLSGGVIWECVFCCCGIQYHGHGTHDGSDRRAKLDQVEKSLLITSYQLLARASYSSRL